LANIIQTNYTGGELSTGISGRTDVEKYYNGCSRLENMLVLDQGGAIRRGGTRFRAAAKYADKKAILAEFVYSTVQAYILEVGHYYIRFYKDGGQIQAEGGGPYEVATPFSEADLEKLTFSQSTDTLFISHPNYQRRLVRLDHNDWRLQNIKIDQPALAIDEYAPVGTLTPGATSGNGIVFTASQPVFLEGDIGCQLRAKNKPGRAEITGTLFYPLGTLAPAAVSGSGIRFRASAAVFMAGDVNAEIQSVIGAGRALIKTVIQESFPIGTLTPGAVSGTDIRFTTSESLLVSGHVGCEFETKDGVGRARITAVVSGTEATCDIVKVFDSTDPIANGDWLLLGNYLTGILPDPLTVAPMSYNVNADITEAFPDTDPIDSEDWRISGASRITNPTTEVMANIIDEFDSIDAMASGDWVLTGGPRSGEISYVAANYSGGSLVNQVYTPSTKLTLTALVDIFRSSDVGKYSRILGGCIEFTKYNNARSIDAIIRRDLPVTTAQYLKFGQIIIESAAWSNSRGWPWHLVFHKNRLVAAGSDNFPETIWGSESGQFYNFLPGSLDADPFEFSLAGDQVNAVQWLISARRLFMGTPNGEFILGSSDQPMNSNNPSLNEESSIGSRRLRAIKRDNMVFFVADSSNRLHTLIYQLNADGFVAKDLNIFSEHLVKNSPVKGLAATKGPQAIVWVWLEDGTLLGLSFQQEHNVWGWHRHTFRNGQVENAACIPGSGGYETWLMVKRTINGAEVRYLETIESYDYQTLLLPDAYFVDCGLTYDGPPVSVITNLEHLEGETLAILADGAVRPQQQVVGGEITLSRPAGKVHAGLPMSSYLQHMPLSVPGTANSINLVEKSISEVTLRLWRSLGFKLGPDEDHLETAYFRQNADPMNSPPALFSGPKRVLYPQGFAQEVQPLVVQDDPLPLNILGAIIKFEPGDPD
jgi:hypothetical protein